MALRAELMLQRMVSSRVNNLLLPLVSHPTSRSMIGVPCAPSRSMGFIFCNRSECAKAETGNCRCKNMREARGAVIAKSKEATKKTVKMIGKVGTWAKSWMGPPSEKKSWMDPLRVLETGRPGKRRADPLGLFDGSSEKEQLDKARRVFRMLDYDGSGFVSEEELRSGSVGTNRVGLKKVFGFEAQEGQVERMMLEADENGDKVISLEEFLSVVSKFRMEEESRAIEIRAKMDAANSARS